MTEVEFKDKVVELIKELNNTCEDRFNIFVFMADIDTGDGLHFGYGCPACAVQLIEGLSKKGHFSHTDGRYNAIH